MKKSLVIGLLILIAATIWPAASPLAEARAIGHAVAWSWGEKAEAQPVTLTHIQVRSVFGAAVEKAKLEGHRFVSDQHSVAKQPPLVSTSGCPDAFEAASEIAADDGDDDDVVQNQFKGGAHTLLGTAKVVLARELIFSSAAVKYHTRR